MQATVANATYVPVDTVITMIMDVSEVDKYDRLLRCVISGNNFVNATMVRNGYAKAVVYEPDSACFKHLQNSNSITMQNDLGMYNPTPTPRPIVYPTKASSGNSGGDPSGCDLSYPTVCIPPSPLDLDCGDIPYRRFTVSGSDRHKFDGDGDGIGCESN